MLHIYRFTLSPSSKGRDTPILQQAEEPPELINGHELITRASFASKYRGITLQYFVMKWWEKCKFSKPYWECLRRLLICFMMWRILAANSSKKIIKKIHPYLTQVGGQQIQEKWNTSHSWFVTYFTACSCNGSSKNVLRNLEEVSHFWQPETDPAALSDQSPEKALLFELLEKKNPAGKALARNQGRQRHPQLSDQSHSVQHWLFPCWLWNGQ